jgi:protein-disulfide isomerase
MRLSAFLPLAFISLVACVSQAEQTNTTTSAEFQTASSAASSDTPMQTIAVSERLLSGGILQIGSADAKVSMLLFINHSSEYSQQFDQNLLPQLIQDFVSHGTLQIGIIPMQFTKYPESQTSAALLVCSSMQGKGQAMNMLLFSKANAATLQKQIGTIGLDLPKLQDCLKGDALKTMMDSEAQLIQSFGITLAPSYTINGAVHTGLPEYADLRAQIKMAMQ